MNAKPLVAAAALAIPVFASTALACGDKLAMIGGGVSFERISHATNPGSVVLLIAPGSPFSQADDELKLAESLRKTGHTVRRVSSTAELESALRDSPVDVVVAYWTDANAVAQKLGGSASAAPTVVPVVYQATPAQLSDATAGSKCVAEVEKRRGKQLAETVDKVLQKRKSGQPVTCTTGGAQHST